MNFLGYFLEGAAYHERDCNVSGYLLLLNVF